MTAPLFDATTKRAFVVAGVLAAAVGVCGFVYRERRAAREARIDAVVAMVQRFKQDIESVVNDPRSTEPDVQAALDRIERESDKWKGFSTEADIVVARMRLVGMLPAPRGCGRRSYREEFDAAAETLENADARSTEQLRRTREKLGELMVSVDADAVERLKIGDWRTRLDHLLVTKTRDESNAFAAQPTTSPRQGLAKYAEAEDYVLKALLDAKKAKNKADEDSYTATYKALLAESDEYALRVITPEFIDAAPWKDLLSYEMGMRWSKTMTVPGFSSRIDDGVLTLTPPDAGGRQKGVAAIFDQKSDDLRHFRLDMEFAVEGVVTMFFHVSPAPQNPDDRQSHAYDLVASKSGFVAGRKYVLTATSIGSVLVLRLEDTMNVNAGGAWCPDPSWTKLRKGGIAFLVPEGARLKVTRMRIKELR